MAKGDTFLAPTIITSADTEELSRLVAAERIKRNQTHAQAHYSAVYVVRPNQGGSSNPGYTKYIAFIEFNTEEK